MAMDGNRELSYLKNKNSKSGIRIANRMSILFKITTVLFLFLLLFPATSTTGSSEPILVRHHIVMIQGDDPHTQDAEPESSIMVLEYLGYTVPWNESVIDIPVPKGSQSVSVAQVDWNEFMGYYPGEYSAYWNPENPPYWEFVSREDMDSYVANSFLWGFPRGADRNLTIHSHLDTDSEFSDFFDDIRSDAVWNFSATGLRLEPGNAFGEYISTVGTVSGVNITSVEVSWSMDSHEENATFALSNSNGTDWMDVTQKKGEVVKFTTQSTELIWRVNMTQDPQINNTPKLRSLSINTTYTPWDTDILLQLSYILKRDSKTSGFQVVMDLTDDHVGPINAPNIVIYLNKDHEVISDDVLLIFVENQTEYPEKDAYVFMTGSYNIQTVLTIQEKEKEDEFPTTLLLSIILIICIAGIILLLIKERREKNAAFETEETADSEGLEELRNKKEGILLAIKKLDSEHQEELIDEDAYSSLRANYKAKAVEVSKKMDAMAALQATAAGITEKALREKKQKILKSIKKLDSDYKEGLIEEEIYGELRAGYKKKAIALSKELEELKKS